MYIFNLNSPHRGDSNDAQAYVVCSVNISLESPLDRQMGGMKGKTQPYAMNKRKYRTHPRT